MAVYFGLHFFSFQRIAGGLDLTGGGRLALKIFFWIAALTFILAEALSRFAWIYPLLYAASVWLGVIAMALCVFLLEWLGGLVFRWPRKASTVVAILLLLALTVISLLRARSFPRLIELDIAVDRLPDAARSFRIVQLSDLHLGNLTSPERVRAIVARANGLRPDLVVITGDLIDRDVCRDDRFCLALGQLRARFGVLAVTGNHEYYAGEEKFAELARRTGMRILHNERVDVGQVLQVVGLDDDGAKGFGQTGPDLNRALAGADPRLPLVLLYHRPTGFLAARGRGVDLQLSGHTHAGQFPPLDLLVWLYYRFPFGLYNVNGGYIYTHRGSGTWGPPMRLTSDSEIVSFTLVPHMSTDAKIMKQRSD